MREKRNTMKRTKKISRTNNQKRNTWKKRKQ